MIGEFLDYIRDLPTEYIIFGTLFLISFFIVLYAITLIHEKLRLLENTLQDLQKEQSVMTDELEIVATANQKDRTDKRL